MSFIVIEVGSSSLFCCFFVVLSLLSCRDVFVYRTSLGQSCSVEEKLEFKKGEDVLEVVKFCYLGDKISC